MLFWLITLLFLLETFYLCSSQNETSGPLINSPLGQYRGSIMKSTELQKTIFSFRGIRYAEAPVNQLRFKPPIAVKKHSGIYDATKDGPVCPQDTKDPISEDCLFLNVYTTKLPEGSENPRRPVIVYIHPGQFLNGTGRSDWAGPQYLMNQEVVLVTFNHRLGILGFLSTGDKEAPGNNGLKDQVTALKWVKENIELFGGDTDSITVFGHSAGALSIILHLVSPMSKGLFHKAAIFSTFSLLQYPMKYDQLDLTKQQAGVVGCSSDNTSTIIKCLSHKPADVLVKSVDQLYEFANFPKFLWQPVIEKDFGQERFLTDHPFKLILEGKFQNVPIATGLVSDELAEEAIELSEKGELLRKLNQEWDKNAPIIFGYERDTQRSKEISNILRNFYFGDKPIDNSTLTSLIQIMNDGLVGFAVDRAARIISAKSSQPVYYYKYSYTGRYTVCPKNECHGTLRYGPVHLDDLKYFFYISSEFPEFKLPDFDFIMMSGSTKSMAYFAKTGHPLHAYGKSDNVDWPPYNVNSQKYMDYKEAAVVKEKLHSQRYALWDKLFPYSLYF